MPSLAGSKTPLFSPSPAESSSITVVGGTRPPVPITVGGGKALPVELTATDGELISVPVRLVAGLGRNSATVPPTVTLSPTLTVGADEVKTKTPSEVASLLSGIGSCI